MKNELNYDMDMCDNSQCPNAGSCMRQLAYQKAVAENYPHPLWVILNPQPGCTLYEPVKTISQP